MKRGRPKRSISETFYDVFADMPMAEQEVALLFLNEIHRQAKRQAAKRWTMPAKEVEAAVDGAEQKP